MSVRSKSPFKWHTCIICTVRFGCYEESCILNDECKCVTCLGHYRQNEFKKRALRKENEIQ